MACQMCTVKVFEVLQTFLLQTFLLGKGAESESQCGMWGARAGPQNTKPQ